MVSRSYYGQPVGILMNYGIECGTRLWRTSNPSPLLFVDGSAAALMMWEEFVTEIAVRYDDADVRDKTLNLVFFRLPTLALPYRFLAVKREDVSWVNEMEWGTSLK